MEPIILSQIGDTLELVNGNQNITDESKLSLCSYIGMHSCGGFVYVIPLLRTNYHVFLCKNCFERKKLPKEVDTYGKLRQWCAEQIGGEEEEGMFYTP